LYRESGIKRVGIGKGVQTARKFEDILALSRRKNLDNISSLLYYNVTIARKAGVWPDKMSKESRGRESPYTCDAEVYCYILANLRRE
jgi:hypothetical protein